MFSFLKGYSPIITNDIAEIVLSNGYKAIVTPSLTKGLFRVELYGGDNLPLTRFEQYEGGHKSINGYLYQVEVMDLLEELSLEDSFVASETIFPVSQSNKPLESLVKPNELPVQRLMIEDATSDDISRYEPSVQKLFSHCERKSFYLSEKAWLSCREHGEYQKPSDPRYIKTAFGGSDVASMYSGSELAKSLHLYDGQVPGAYKTAKEFWTAKTHPERLICEEKGKEDIFFMGHALESAVADCFERAYRKDHPEDTIRVFKDPHMYQCGRKDKNGNLELPFVLCDIDRFVVINGVKGILELKTCQFSSKDYPIWEKGLVPLHYYLQLQWYMLCMNVPYAYIACLTGINLTSLTYIYVERNYDVEDLIIKMGKNFANMVENDIEPDFDKEEPLENIMQYWRKVSGPYDPTDAVVKFDETKIGAIQKLLNINSTIEMLNAQIEELKEDRLSVLNDEVFPYMNSFNRATVRIDDKSFYELRLKKKPRSIDIDEKRLEADHPDIYSRYLKQVSATYAKSLKASDPASYALYIKAHKPKFDKSKFMKEHPEMLTTYYIADTGLKDKSTFQNDITITYKEVEQLGGK